MKLSSIGQIVGQVGKQISDRVSLDNINRILPNGKVQDFSNYIDTSWRNIKQGMSDNFIKYTGIDKNIAKKFDNFKYSWNNDDFIGKKTPEGIEITPENVGMIRNAQDKTSSLFTKDGLPLIPGTTLPETVRIAQASNVYKLLR